MNEILTLPEKIIDTARQSWYNMNGTISQLHKGGSINKTSDQSSVVLLNSGYELLNYILLDVVQEFTTWCGIEISVTRKNTLAFD